MANIYENVVRSQDAKLLFGLPAQFKQGFYLAGGTGLALQLGHRYSYDFGLFAESDFDPTIATEELRRIGQATVLQQARGTLELVINDTRFAFFYYPYPIYAPFVIWRDIRIASLEDIAAMKIMAIAGRGSCKDFIDLYFVSRRLDLLELMQVASKKYGRSNINLYHIVKSLGYFEDARKEPMPKMISPCEWEEVEEFFSQQQTKLAERLL